jgi:hypothetical protein
MAIKSDLFRQLNNVFSGKRIIFISSTFSQFPKKVGKKYNVSDLFEPSLFRTREKLLQDEGAERKKTSHDSYRYSLPYKSLKYSVFSSETILRQNSARLQTSLRPQLGIQY